MVIAGMSIVAVGLVALCNLYAVISNTPHTQNRSSVKVYGVREVWSQEVFHVVGRVNPTLCHGRMGDCLWNVCAFGVLDILQC